MTEYGVKNLPLKAALSVTTPRRIRSRIDFFPKKARNTEKRIYSEIIRQYLPDSKEMICPVIAKLDGIIETGNRSAADQQNDEQNFINCARNRSAAVLACSLADARHRASVTDVAFANQAVGHQWRNRDDGETFLY